MTTTVMNEPTRTERNHAIDFLAGAIPEETLANVLMLMQKKQTLWLCASHFGLGLQIRNALRGAGFGWSDGFLDDHWYRPIEEAARIGDQRVSPARASQANR